MSLDLQRRLDSADGDKLAAPVASPLARPCSAWTGGVTSATQELYAARRSRVDRFSASSTTHAHPRTPRVVTLVAGLAPAQSPTPEARPGTGLVFDLQSYRGAPFKAPLTDASYTSVPSRASLEVDCPTAGDQGSYGTCVAFAVAYHTRTILWGIEHRVWDDATFDSAVFSPTFLYEQIKDPTDFGREQGTNPIRALDLMKHLGVAPLTAVPYACGGTIETEDLLAALENTIIDYQTLFAPDEPDAGVRVRTVKKALAEDCPVVIGFTVADSFYRPSGFVWRPAPTDAGPSGAHGRHAMVVVGYEDGLGGGSFRVLNSWGPGWGDRGFIWIPYDVFASYSLCAIQVHGRKPPPLPPTPDPSPTPSPTRSPAPRLTPSPAPPVTLSRPSSSRAASSSRCATAPSCRSSAPRRPRGANRRRSSRRVSPPTARRSRIPRTHASASSSRRTPPHTSTPSPRT
jgi:hypothetical protein